MKVATVFSSLCWCWLLE